MFDLAGRTALVTGAGQGMGLGIARGLARRGARVAVNDYHPERAQAAAAQLHAEGYNAMGVAADVRDAAAVEAMVEQIAGAGQRVDILVNNAGIPADGMLPVAFRDMPRSDWARYIDLNLYGVLNCTRAVLDPMCEAGWGRVITISSEAWRTGNGMGISLYAAAKAGAVGFSRQLSSEVGRFGVTVNCVSLGMMANIPEVTRIARNFPVPRPGTPDDVAACCVYLASEEAAWVTGQSIPVNGGVVTA